MPVHPHLGNLIVPSFAEDGASSLNPLTSAPTPEDTFEFGREPWSGGVDLAGTERDL